jgi:glycosyltransferase involved in cell wall biosynthesis
MRILYLLTTLPPKLPVAEAISQEISALQSRFGGDTLYLNPNQHSPIFIPRLLFGFHKLKQLRALEQTYQLHHFYNPDPFPFPFLRLLRRPVIYSISCGIENRRPNVAFLNSLAAVAAADERSLGRLREWGVKNVNLVRSGIDTSRFSHAPLPPPSPHSEIKLMVGSAPWTKGQFHSKGVEVLLEAARQEPRLHLIFLWRGVLAEEMEQRVRQMKLEQQVEVINRQVDVNRVLAGVHASILLVTRSAIIKSYPHSLLDSLAAGKPVLVSRSIPMADYVEQTGCGEVVEQVTPADMLAAVEALVSRYEVRQQVARQVGQRDFAHEAMIASFQQLYECVAAAHPLPLAANR